MQQSTYEAHYHPDPDFPIIFHLDTVQGRLQSGSFLHWHENVELLFGVEGEAVVTSNADRIPLCPGELVVVNADHLHSVYCAGSCRYYCLIADKSLFDSAGLPFGAVLLQPRITDDAAAGHFSRIVREMEEKRPYYKAAVVAQVIALAVLLCRSYPAQEIVPNATRRNNQVDMVKAAVRYIRRRCCEELTIDDIGRHVGFSKYYLCHTFKEITGSTVVSFINYLRCRNARSLFSTGQYSISESAALSGFNNMSYFSRTYKAQMGVSPSAQRMLSLD